MTNSFKLDEEGYPTLKGVLADLATNYMKCAHMPVKKMAYLSAIMFGATVCSRYYSFMDTYSNLYSVLCAPSGSGKNDVITMMGKWARYCKADDLIRSTSGFTSDAAVFSSLANHPQQCALIDEYGKVITGMIRNPSASTALSVLTKAYTSSHWKLDPKEYSDDGKKKKDEARNKTIMRPALNLIGVGEESQLREVITCESIKEGFMSRYLFWQVRETELLDLDYIEAPDPIPDRARDRIQEILRTGYDIAGKDTNDSLVILTNAINEPTPRDPMPCIMEGGKDYLNQIRNDYYNKAYQTKDELAPIIRRIVEVSKRVAIIFELLNQPYNTMQHIDGCIHADGITIHQSTFSQAISLVTMSMEKVRTFLDETNTPPYHNRIEELGDWIINLFKEYPASRFSIQELNQRIDDDGKKVIHITAKNLSHEKSNTYLYDTNGNKKYAGTVVDYLQERTDIVYAAQPNNEDYDGIKAPRTTTKFFYIDDTNALDNPRYKVIKEKGLSQEAYNAIVLVRVMDLMKCTLDEATAIVNDDNKLDDLIELGGLKLPDLPK